MKKIKLLSVFAILVIALGIYACSGNDETAKTQANCLPTNLQNGVIAFYPFNNGSINDFSGNNYHLTNTTTASSGADRAGNPNCAYNFVKANNDFLKYSNPTFLDNFQTQPFSISLWYKPVGTWSFECLIGRDIGGRCPDTHGQWSVALFDLRKPVFGINQRCRWYNDGVNYNPANYNNVWQHLVVTCIGNDLKLYRNGILSPNAINDGTGYNCNPPSQPTVNVGDLFIGKLYNGLLDDVIIYNRVLTLTEVTELYNLSPCCQ